MLAVEVNIVCVELNEKNQVNQNRIVRQSETRDWICGQELEF